MMKLVVLFAGLQIGWSSAALDSDQLTRDYYGNDAAWYKDRVPLFESSDADITEVYYYRWNIFRAHQRDLGENGFISTEFLDDVGWQTQPWASLNDATGFHLQEGRWCRDRRFKNDYAKFIYSSQSNTRQFSESMADAVYKGYLVDGDADTAVSLLESMKGVFEAWLDSYDTTKGLYWVEPLRDATEYTIASIDASGGKDGFSGGQGFRPSINSYQYANARAIAKLAAIQGDQDTVNQYNDRAEALKKNVQESLWNSTFGHFIDRYYVENEYVNYWEPIRGRELVGYVPWTHDLPDDNPDYSTAWTQLSNTSEFAGVHGLRTVGPTYEYFMRQYRYEGSNPECQWNGPSWPYQTTQVLTGLANLLDHYPNSRNEVTNADYTQLLKQYAQIHHNPERGGILDLEEDYDAATGAPIVGLVRSPHYFHSGYIDNILTGFVGIRPRDDDTLEVNPLADATTTTFFRADRIPYHGHDVAVQWDADGTRYGTKGLVVEVDGNVVASSDRLERVTATVSGRSATQTSGAIAKSIQLQEDTEYPRGSVSVPDVSTAAIHDVIDGRIWFWPELVNGWDTPEGDGNELWYAIDFGNTTDTNSAEIAFYAAEGFDVPVSYKVEVGDDDTWKEVSGAEYNDPVANGMTTTTWSQASGNGIRLVFTPKDGQKVRLVEFKVY